jgi:hypothetical protein
MIPFRAQPDRLHPSRNRDLKFDAGCRFRDDGHPEGPLLISYARV